MKNQLLEKDDKRMNEKLEQLEFEKKIQEERKKEEEELMEKEVKERSLKVAENRLEFLRIREVCTGLSVNEAQAQMFIDLQQYYFIS